MATNNPISSALRYIEARLTTAKGRYQSAMRSRRGRQLAARTLAQLQQLPGPPHYPIRWASRKQQRKFFATNGFDGGIPHKRKGTIAADWSAEFVPDNVGGVLALTNPHNEVQWINGPNTQPFHLDTGWVQLDDVAEQAYAELEGVATEVWYQAADPFEGMAQSEGAGF